MSTFLMAYRGDITALRSRDNQFLFVTIHPEKQATKLYQVEIQGSLTTAGSYQLYETPLPCGGNDLLLSGNTIWIAGQDGKLYSKALDKPKSALAPLIGVMLKASPVHKLAHLDNGYLALLQEQQLNLLHCNSGKIRQTLPLPDSSTVIATDPSGQWLAVGFINGEIAVYQLRDGQLHFSAQAKLHEGRVSAIAFETNELRFYSAGADKKLYSTHAQGELQALDKGKSSNHEGVIQQILIGDQHFFTGASDKSIKAWAFSGGRPQTINKGLHRVLSLAKANLDGKQVLVTANADNSLRLLPLSSKEEPNEVQATLKDGYAWADNRLQNQDIKYNESAVQELAAYNDQKAFNILTDHLQRHDKKDIREQIIAVAAASEHPAATKLLETGLNDKKHETVRQAAYAGLVKRIRKDSIHPYTLALDSGFVDTGSQALEALAKLAKKHPQAEQALIGALQHQQRGIHLLALYLLEGVYAKTDPKASLYALQTQLPELQRAALIRLYQRDLLANPEVQRALLNAQDSNDGWVRQTALLIAILGQPALAAELKQRDADLARQLQELEDFDLRKPDGKAKGDDTTLSAAGSGLLKKLKQTLKNSGSGKLTDASLTPLLQGMTSRHADMCFQSGFAMAVLQDQRAFGLLLLLSQEQDTHIRIGACRAFALLQQYDALPQLEILLNDQDDSVRDAAFIAISLLETDVWQQVRYGFAAEHEDIHRRALKTLLDALGKRKTLPETGLNLLKQALNDPFESIRQETFKACLNRKLGGDLPATLRLLLASQYQNVHHEVLNETLANLREDWALALLPELFEDEFEAIRQAALKQALKEKKRFIRHMVLEQAVASRFVDIRTAALQQLRGSKPGKDDWQLLVQLIDDEADSLRQQALQSIVTVEDNTALVAAMQSQYRDTRLQATVTCAALGMEQAFDPLIQLVSRDKPEKKPQQEAWRSEISQALQGLAALEDKRTFDPVLTLINEPDKYSDKTLTEEAAHVLPWISADEHTEALLPLLNDERVIVRANAALALALLNNEQGLAALTDANTRNQLTLPFTLAAALMQQPLKAAGLQHFLSMRGSWHSATLALFSHELLLHGERPTLSLQLLTLDNPPLQRLAADIISRYHEPEAVWRLLQQRFSRALKPGDQPQWEIPLPELKQIAAMLVYGEPHARARLLYLLSMLDHNDTRENWQQHYRAFSRLYADSIVQAASQISIQLPVSDEVSDAQTRWQQTAFGAYLGLLRAEDDNPSATLNLHQQAINGLRQLAEQGDNAQRQGVISCLLTLLNHPHSVLRDKAYDDLLELKLPAEELGRAALASRHDDMARLGLQLLVTHYPLKQSHQLLQDTVRTGSPALAQEAYQLLLDDQGFGLAQLAPVALESYTPQVRIRCVTELNGHYHDPALQKLLVAASQNRQRDVAQQAAYALARHQHPGILDTLQELWHSSEDTYQQQLILQAFRQWRGDGAAGALLACLDKRMTLRLGASAVYQQVGQFRDPAVADDLLKQLQTDKPENRAVANAILTISGYDQVIQEDVDTDEVPAERSWMEKQFPRYDGLLVRLFGVLTKTDRHSWLSGLLPGMVWMAANSQADQALAEAAAVADKDLLETLLETIAIRARRRQGSVEALLAQLTHKNPDIQFLAAEGLGRSGHAQGNNVLLAASEYLDDIEQRERAIIALGESGDPSVLDKLLELAENKEHALNEAAIEAIGHLGQSDQADKILKLLQQALKHADYYSEMNERALNGLRWFNTLAAWESIMDFIRDETRSEYARAQALTQLHHYDTTASRDLLLKTLRESRDYQQVEAAYDSARFLWQPSTEEASPVDLALIRGHLDVRYFGDQKTLERITRYASTDELLALLAEGLQQTDQSVLRQLQQALMQRTDHQPATLTKGLSAERSDTVGIIAHLVALLPKPVKAVQTVLQQALETHHARWQQGWEAYQRNPDRERKQRRDVQQNTLDKLLWAAVVQQVHSPLLVACLQSQDKSARLFQPTLLTALLRVEQCNHTELLAAVQPLLESSDQAVRALAQQVMRQHGENNDPQGWESFLHQPQVLAETHFTPVITQAARSDRHARALPVLIRQQNDTELAAIANDDSLDEIQRIGAIEGLGRIYSDAAESHLQSLYQQEGIDEDIGKAAFRALRRSQRARAKMSHTRGAAA